jgi:hypothetical protein
MRGRREKEERKGKEKGEGRLGREEEKRRRNGKYRPRWGEEKGRKRKREMGVRSRGERKRKKERKWKKRIRDTWRLVNGWEEIMKSFPTNRVMPCGRGNYPIHLKFTTYINYSRAQKC